MSGKEEFPCYLPPVYSKGSAFFDSSHKWNLSSASLPTVNYDRYNCIPAGEKCFSLLGTRNPCCQGPLACTKGPDDLGNMYCGYNRDAVYTGFFGRKPQK